MQFSDAAGRDDLGEWDNAAFQFTPLFPGYYQIEAQVRLSGLATTDAVVLQAAKPNGWPRISMDWGALTERARSTYLRCCT
ncbi:hypothetical protein ACOJBM_31670 [Rhizobium beringeri]